MANGKNVGRLFGDCTNEYGYGEYHEFPATTVTGDIVKCRNCERVFMIVGDTAREVTNDDKE